MLKGSKDTVKMKVKKKSKPKNFFGKGLKIVDDESFSMISKPASDSDDEEVEDLPQIAAVVDERPVEVQVLESFHQSKWKRVEENEEKDSSLSRSGERSLKNSPLGYRGSQEDISPPRQRTRQGSHDMSPPRQRIRRGSDDISPPRQRKRRGSDDVSPPRQRMRRESDDVSLPRHRTRKDSRDRASGHRTRRNSSDDISPPRQSRRRHSSDDASPPRRREGKRNDRSPPRRRRNSRDSPTSRKGRDRSSSPSSHRKRDSDASFPSSGQRRRRNSSDTSPPRRKNATPPRSSDGRRRERDRNLARPEVLETSESDGKIKITLDGKKAGLQKAAALRDEMLDFRKRENEMFETLPDEVSGRNAKAVIRDRRTEAEIVKEQEKQKKEEERKTQYNKWGKGLKQVEEQEARVRSALHEIAKPLARYKDDEDLDDHLKKIDREGDPMLEYLTAKRRKATGGVEKPRYNGPPPPPNRFNIPPGYRWDGVDRSNGYEKEWFSRINAKKAVQEEAYKWSVEDL